MPSVPKPPYRGPCRSRSAAAAPEGQKAVGTRPRQSAPRGPIRRRERRHRSGPWRQRPRRRSPGPGPGLAPRRPCPRRQGSSIAADRRRDLGRRRSRRSPPLHCRMSRSTNRQWQSTPGPARHGRSHGQPPGPGAPPGRQRSGAKRAGSCRAGSSRDPWPQGREDSVDVGDGRVDEKDFTTDANRVATAIYARLSSRERASIRGEPRVSMIGTLLPMALWGRTSL